MEQTTTLLDRLSANRAPKEMSGFVRAVQYALLHPDYLGAVTDETIAGLGFTLDDLADAGEALLQLEAERMRFQMGDAAIEPSEDLY